MTEYIEIYKYYCNQANYYISDEHIYKNIKPYLNETRIKILDSIRLGSLKDFIYYNNICHMGFYKQLLPRLAIKYESYDILEYMLDYSDNNYSYINTSIDYLLGELSSPLFFDRVYIKYGIFKHLNGDYSINIIDSLASSLSYYNIVLMKHILNNYKLDKVELSKMLDRIKECRPCSYKSKIDDIIITSMIDLIIHHQQNL